MMNSQARVAVVGGAMANKATTGDLYPMKITTRSSVQKPKKAGASGTVPCQTCGRQCSGSQAQNNKTYCTKCWDSLEEQALKAVQMEVEMEKKAETEKVSARNLMEKERAEEKKELKEMCDAQYAEERQAAEAACWKVAKERAQGKAEAQPAFFICGSWDNDVPHEMVFNPVRECHVFSTQIGKSGWESFKIIANGASEQCVHQGTIGGENAAAGDFYEIAFTGSAVDALKLGKGSASTAGDRYWLTGSWDKGVAHEMDWDPIRQHFRYFVRLGAKGEENFQILLNCDLEQRLYPEWPMGSFHAGDAMWGPDEEGEGKNWSIGRHKFDKKGEGVCYEVRLRLRPDGSAQDVDWVMVDAFAVDSAPLVQQVSESDAAVRLYGQRFSEKREDVPSNSDDETAEPSHSASGSSDGDDRAALDEDVANALKQQKEIPAVEVDADGEEMHLCGCCGLPVGDFGYAAEDGDDRRVHGECMAQKVIDDMRKKDEDRIREDSELKLKKRKEYEIGWKVEQIPRSITMAKKLQCSPLPQGMCCLVLDREWKTVRVVPTMEPAASVNLAYLATALQVRLREGKEPFFSLDPAGADLGKDDALFDPKLDPERSMQVKRFEPEWLAGTRVGEVMFQADYHLKELSMGEYEQPVLGMTSCHDLLEADGIDKEWNAREWFVIKRAQVQMSCDDVLLPFVKMGVEAREQVRGEDGLEDVKITRPDHPMVRYAETFTENFDLIAERKSVIFHLRELAKATVMAKYLVDAQISLDDSWFTSRDEVAPGPMEIPQLWNERSYSQVHVSNGHVRDMDKGIAAKTHGIYGGVQLGVPGVPAAQLAVPGMPAIVTAPAPTRMAARLAPSVSGVSTMGRLVAAGPAGVKIAPTPKGVDLNLGQFDLSEAVEAVDGVEGSWTGSFQCSDASLAMGGAFWSSLKDGTETALKSDDKNLLNAIFNPKLSDRREEGDCFVPPDTSASYVRRLQELVQREETLKQQRLKHFCSTDFTMDNVGALFPRSWRSSIDLARTSGSKSASLCPRTDFKAQAAALQEILKTSSPAFEKSTEDGVTFRVYRVGSLEVRTTQDSDGHEIIAAVFSTSEVQQTGEQNKASRDIQDTDKVVTVTEYVESAGKQGQRHYFAVLLIEGGAAVVTEQLEDGRVTFEANPANLECRSSLAKAFRSTNSRAAQITVSDMRKHAETATASCGAPCLSKCYASGVSNRAGAVKA